MEEDGTISLSAARSRREEDNANLTPVDLVELISDHLARGRGPGVPLRMLAMVEYELPDGNRKTESFRSGCSRYEELALLVLWQRLQLEDWFTS